MNKGCLFLARDSIYGIARYMLSPVRLSVTQVDQSQTVEVRIMHCHHIVAPWL